MPSTPHATLLTLDTEIKKLKDSNTDLQLEIALNELLAIRNKVFVNFPSEANKDLGFSFNIADLSTIDPDEAAFHVRRLIGTLKFMERNLEREQQESKSNFIFRFFRAVGRAIWSLFSRAESSDLTTRSTIAAHPLSPASQTHNSEAQVERKLNLPPDKVLKEATRYAEQAHSAPLTQKKGDLKRAGEKSAPLSPGPPRHNPHGH